MEGEVDDGMEVDQEDSDEEGRHNLFITSLLYANYLFLLRTHFLLHLTKKLHDYVTPGFNFILSSSFIY